VKTGFGRSTLGRHGRRWEDSIRRHHQEIGRCVGWLSLIAVRKKWRAVVNTVMNFSASKNETQGISWLTEEF
jgi:hypothetical protein